jgi:hypothetical protein
MLCTTNDNISIVDMSSYTSIINGDFYEKE